MNRRKFIFGMASIPLMDLLPLTTDPKVLEAVNPIATEPARGWYVQEISLRMHRSGTAFFVNESGEATMGVNPMAMNIGKRLAMEAEIDVEKTLNMKGQIIEKYYHPDTARVLEEFKQAVLDAKYGPNASSL